MDWRGRCVLLAGLLVLAGLLSTGAAAQAAEAPPDPETDVIGWEDGYWHNESIQVDQSDGLSDAEQEAYVSRTAARIEVLRNREFQSTVPVTVIDRSEYRSRTAGNSTEAYRAWNNQVWEALFVVGEDQDVEEALHSTSTAATTGGYFFASEEIRIITDTPEQPVIDRRTLAHELVHAQQDQYHDLVNVTADADSQDEQLATNGLVEGEANYLEAQYEARCGTEWECVSSPDTDGGGGGADDLNLGIFVTIYHPYSDGPPYVNALVEDGNWEAVDAAFEEPPDSTEQIIHHTDESPSSLAVDDEAEAGWLPFTGQGQNGTDTAGEASMFSMMWYQASEYDAETIPLGTISQTDAPYDTYNYDADPTAGWGNDAILPYRKNTVGGPRYGYVWVTEWDTEGDAREFRQTYRQILDAHDARRLGPRTWVIDSGPFADAFRVVRDGRRVTVVNGPRVADLDALRPSLSDDAEEPDPGTTTLTSAPTTSTPEGEGPGSPMEPEDTPQDDGGMTTAPGQPGFGALAAVAGLLGWRLLRRRRGRH